MIGKARANRDDRDFDHAPRPELAVNVFDVLFGRPRRAMDLPCNLGRTPALANVIRNLKLPR